MALNPLFPFRQAQYVPVFPLKPAPYCMLFAGLGNTNKSAISLLFSYYVTLVLSSPPSFFLSQTLWQIWQELSSYSSYSFRLQWIPGHSFLPGNDAADELARRGALFAPSAIPCSLSSLISTLVFSRTGGVLSHLNSLTHRFHRFPPRNLCSLCSLASTLQRTQHSVRFLSLQDSQNQESFLQRLWTLVPGLLSSSHSALSSYGLFAPFTLSRLLVSLRPLVQTVGSCPASGAPRSSAMPPSLGRGRVTNNNSHHCLRASFYRCV